MNNRFYGDNNFPEDLFSGMGNDENEEFDDDDDDHPHHMHDPDEDFDPDYEREREEVAEALELERRDLNQKILFETIGALEKSWLWRFRSTKTKLKMTTEAYYNNLDLIIRGEYRFMEYLKDKQ